MTQIARKRNPFAAWIALAAWLVPGLGYLLLKRPGRAAAIFVAAGGLAIAGYALRGKVFLPHAGDPFGTLGFLADICSGMFYWLSHFIERAGPDVSRAAGDDGTRFIAASGVVNLLAVLDTYEIAAGWRT